MIPEFVGQFKVGHKIGSGAFSDVFQGINALTKENVALKFIKRDILEDFVILEMVDRELRILRQITHKNIVKCHNIIFLDDFIVIVMEHLSNGTISRLRATIIYDIDTSIILRWGKEILEGLEYLHKKGIAHHDIKPDNIGFDDSMSAKIMDLGLCEESGKDCYMKSGTPFFRAPEIKEYGKYDGTKADIWSFGVTFHFLATGFLPFKNGTPNYYNNILNVCPEPLNTIVDMALEVDVKKRATATEILNLKIFEKAEKSPRPLNFNCNQNNIPTRRTMRKIIVAPIRNIVKTRQTASADLFKNRCLYKTPSIFM